MVPPIESDVRNDPSPEGTPTRDKPKAPTPELDNERRMFSRQIDCTAPSDRVVRADGARSGARAGGRHGRRGSHR
jgi:hypothetical protein